MSTVLTAELQKDVRLIERGLAKGFLSRAAANKLAKDLPDLTAKADWIDIESEDDDEDEEDDDVVAASDDTEEE
jgi:hypothetical protein